MNLTYLFRDPFVSKRLMARAEASGEPYSEAMVEEVVNEGRGANWRTNRMLKNPPSAGVLGRVMCIGIPTARPINLTPFLHCQLTVLTPITVSFPLNTVSV